MGFLDRLEGALYGTAVGDAMGAPVEGWPSHRILAQFGAHDFHQFIPPTHDHDPNRGKGAGRITDDTLMTEALILAYGKAQAHLDAYGYVRYLLPQVKNRPVWIPERQAEQPIWERLWFPEKYPWLRLVPANAEPRTAGMGNMVNCGVAMWMMPVGAVNAGDPQGAYQEAVLLGSAHNESFAVEAGAVMAAAAAEALGPSSTIATVVAAATDLSRDGTHMAIQAACAAANPADDLEVFIARTRQAVAPYDQRQGHVTDDDPLAVAGLSNLGRPSRTSAIEELPVALAALRYGDGDFLRTLRAAVCYGRDCDSIAGMAAALCGALRGRAAIPKELLAAANAANRRDFSALAKSFGDTIAAILAQDDKRLARRRQAIATGTPRSAASAAPRRPTRRPARKR